ncbi:DUF1642 domain-containing protein [Lacticaseibacillus paracasei]|uniref:DUF1642 domain-containing protein n=1 Tax=Lacticaseibacillus paracasei TaxID=1597 RepID=UPI0031F6876D
MSEEKLYAIKNDEGKYLDFGDNRVYKRFGTANRPVTRNYIAAREIALLDHGYVVAFVEEPKKVVLTKEQAEIVEGARDGHHPASVLRFSGKDDEELLMNAYVNGYTVEKEKKYLVYKVLGGKQKHELFAQAYRPAIFPDTITWSVGERRAPKTGASAQFTESEIEHYGLQDCEKEEVTDDGE